MGEEGVFRVVGVGIGCCEMVGNGTAMLLDQDIVRCGNTCCRLKVRELQRGESRRCEDQLHTARATMP